MLQTFMNACISIPATKVVWLDNLQRTALRSSMCQFLSEDSWLADHGLFNAAMDLLSTAVKYQVSSIPILTISNMPLVNPMSP